MSDTSLVNLTEIVSSFHEAFTIARDGFLRAGKIYADAIARFGPNAREQFAAAVPGITASVWRRLELLGSGQLDQRLLTASSSGAAALRRLPVTDQQRALDHGVEVLVANGDHILVPVDSMTPQQVRQVFSSDRIRDLSSQRAWLETNAPQTVAPARKVDAPAWRVVGGKVRVERPCELSRVELAKMMMELG